MAEDVQFSPSWEDEATQCKNCKSFQNQGEKNACVPEGETFEGALEKYGEVTPNGHCKYFQAK